MHPGDRRPVTNDAWEMHPADRRPVNNNEAWGMQADRPPITEDPWGMHPTERPLPNEERPRGAQPGRGRRRRKSRGRLLAVVIVVCILAAGGLVVSLMGTGSTVKPPIAAADSKAHCITLPFRGGVINQSQISDADQLTGMTYNCLSTFANPAPDWTAWETPWMFSTTSDGWDAWLKASPTHQAIMGMDLIPQSVSNNKNPLTWEQACAAGDYNQHATALAQNLVSYGAGSVVIRLGVEANGDWEADFVGSTKSEMSDWAKCYDNEVTAMRAVAGTHFLFVWNPNACTANLPLSGWYPGNSYVDIIGVDAYDEDCSTLKTVSQEGWEAYATNSATNNPNDPNFPSIDNIAAFAAAHGKPLSFPEWGLDTGKPDDAQYVTNMGKLFNNSDFAFETYFDTNDDGIAPLGSSIPKATAAYSQAFK
jgi:Glycosyl hydrolase family 26